MTLEQFVSKIVNNRYEDIKIYFDGEEATIIEMLNAMDKEIESFKISTVQADISESGDMWGNTITIPLIDIMFKGKE